jgi:hypothetical protein
MPVIPKLGRLRQKHHGFKASLGFDSEALSQKDFFFSCAVGNFSFLGNWKYKEETDFLLSQNFGSMSESSGPLRPTLLAILSSCGVESL